MVVVGVAVDVSGTVVIHGRGPEPVLAGEVPGLAGGLIVPAEVPVLVERVTVVVRTPVLVGGGDLCNN